MIWGRHSHYKEALFGPERNLNMVPAYSAAVKKGISFYSFMDLLVVSQPQLAQPLSWCVTLHQLACATVAQLEVDTHPETTGSCPAHGNIVSVLLDICAELSFELLFDKLMLCASPSTGPVSMDVHKQRMLMSLGISQSMAPVATYEQ